MPRPQNPAITMKAVLIEPDNEHSSTCKRRKLDCKNEMAQVLLALGRTECAMPLRDPMINPLSFSGLSADTPRRKTVQQHAAVPMIDAYVAISDDEDESGGTAGRASKKRARLAESSRISISGMTSCSLPMGRPLPPPPRFPRHVMGQ